MNPAMTTTPAIYATTYIAVEEENRRKARVLIVKTKKKERGMKKAELENLIGRNVKITDAFGQSVKGNIETVNDSTIVLVDKNLRRTFVALDFVAKLRVD